MNGKATWEEETQARFREAKEKAEYHEGESCYRGRSWQLLHA